jgi:hypothetical protein
MADIFTETKSTSFFGRSKNALGGIFIGTIFFIGSFILLFLNEGRAVRTQKGLQEGAAVVVSVASNSVNPSNEGKLVHSSGNLTTSGPVIDSLFQVQSPDAVKLERTVEMYQWKESQSSKTEKKVGGSEETVTTYTYEKGWSPERIDSSRFKEPAGHANPSQFPYPPAEILAKEVKMNAFRVSPELIRQLGDAEPFNLSQSDLDRLPANLKGQLALSSGKFYSGKNPSEPLIGDTQVSYSVVRPSLVTIVALQKGDSFHPYLTRQGTTIEMIQRGEKTSVEMFEEAMASNRKLTWILRGLGFVLMFIGIRLTFRPLQVMAEIIPLVGWIVGAGVSLICFLLALSLSLATIAFAWIYYRPLLGVSLLAATVGIFILIHFSLKKGRAKIAAPSPLKA